MIDPFSFATGVAGLISLADLVATKGYRYIRAVKNCDEEVKQLVAELDFLGGALRRLEILAKEEKDAGDDDPEAALENSYVYECQMTLREINSILKGFERKATEKTPSSNGQGPSRRAPAVTETDEAKEKIKLNSFFSRMSLHDLRWPLSKHKTVELIERLERHKTTCVIALSADAVSTMHQILGQGRIIKGQLAEMRSIQDKTLEMSITDKNDKSARLVLDWFSSVDPATIHQLARALYQQGTGKWFINGPKFVNWHETPNSALWIYGIPGAGKTILSSSIVEEMFNLKVSGVAYYYCTYRDSDTQKPTNIIGSLVRQLADQSREAFLQCEAFYLHHNPIGRPPARPSEAELGKLLQRISKCFGQVSIIVDGLDECGAAAGIDRSELTRVLSQLHDSSLGCIRMVIISRQLQDIGASLTKFDRISIAAMSSDLELYVAAEVIRRGVHKIRDPLLREEIIETLINGAEGMFQWVKCQLDYLFRLPSDSERRKALKTLPPDLDATYIRILEQIDKDCAPQTQTLVHRVLIWLAFEEAPILDGFDDALTLDSIPTAIAIDTINGNVDYSIIPDPTDIADWCSSLVRMDEFTGKLTFSHFSVKEFLLSEGEKVPSLIARKFLLNKSRDVQYLAEACLTYLSLQELPAIVDYDDDMVLQRFEKRYPLYAHAAASTMSYLKGVDSALIEAPSLSKFFTTRANCYFTLWYQYVAHTISVGIGGGSEDLFPHLNPLHLAVCVKLLRTVERLLEEGADVNAWSGNGITPVFCTILDWLDLVYYGQYGLNTGDIGDMDDPQGCNLAILKLLVSYGADLSDVIKVSDLRSGKVFRADPFFAALVWGEIDVCHYFLTIGAQFQESLIEQEGLKSMFRSKIGVARVLELVSHEGWIQNPGLQHELLELLANIVDIQENPTDNESEENVENGPETSNDLLLAIRFGNEAALEQMLSNGADVEVRSSDGRTPLYLAVALQNPAFASRLLRYGADPYAVHANGSTPLFLSYTAWKLSRVKEIFGPRDSLDLTTHQQYQLLQTACSGYDVELLEHVLSQYEDPTDEKRRQSIHLISPITNTFVLKILNSKGLLSSTERYRTVSEACKIGDEEMLREALEQCTTNELAELEVVASSSTPLCRVDEFNLVRMLLQKGLSKALDLNNTLAEACEKGEADIVELLLSSGADANFPRDDGTRPIHLVACRIEILVLLTSRGVNVNARDRVGATALHWACELGSVCSVILLLENGGLVNLKAGLDFTALHYAARYGREQECRLLIEAGADCELQTMDYKFRALHYAARHGHLSVVETLLHYKSDPWSLTEKGDNALHLAAYYGHFEIVRRFLEIPAPNLALESTNSLGLRPLHLAALSNNATICQALLQAGAGLDAHDSGHGFTPLFVALGSGHSRTVDVLLKAGANIVLNAFDGSTVLHASVKHIDLLSRFILMETDLNAANDDGDTALHLAASYGEPAAIRVILEQGPAVNLTNASLKTPLDIVEVNKLSEWKVCAALLIDAGGVRNLDAEL